jgi:CheY-like chemotaxis protein
MTLPLLAGAVKVPAAAALQRPPDAGDSDLRDTELLIVDNDRATIDALEVLVQNAGARVRTATNAEEALAAIAAQRPDVLLSDIYMPGQDGTELARALRAQEASGARRVFALAMTSETGPLTRERVLTAGFDDFLAKPIDAEQLIDRVRAETAMLGAAAQGSEPAQRVLVVEDDPAALEAIAALLHSDARRVLAARSGAEALRLAAEEPPDLLITDYRLPDMTGAELVAALSREGQRVPAVALTGHSRADLGADAEAFVRVLRKPVAIAELEAALRLDGT